MKRYHTGFTFIEILIVLGGLVLFFGVSLGFYTNFGDQKKLESDSRGFTEVLELAKKKIAAGDKPSAGCILSSFTVSYSGSAYSLTAQCPSNVALITNQTLSNSTVFTTEGTVVSKPLGSGISYSESCILIKNTSTNKCRKITLEQSGVITETKNDTCSC